MNLPDIDIDFADRNMALEHITYIPASKVENNHITKHIAGAYLQRIPVDPITRSASIDYKEAEDRGYIKIDFLNLDIYKSIGSNEEIDRLMQIEPNWDLLSYKEISDHLFHLNGNFDILEQLKPRSIDELAIAIAIKMPGKRHLLKCDMDQIKSEIWTKVNAPYFKKSHSYAYAMVIIIQLNYYSEKFKS